jgi:signal transduction histidine kinase
MDSAADILHELRTSLHSIQGFVRLILDGRVADPETQRQFLATVERQSQVLNDLVDELVDILATGSAPKTMKNQHASMKEAILSTIRKLGGLAAEKEITIDTELDEHLPPVQGDEQALGRVVTNLLHNAIKFSPRAGKITIRASERDDELLTQVTDQGTGVPRQSVPHLFEKICRDHSAVTQAVGGMGLGLYLCRRIVDAHGGRICVEGERHRGNTFSFTIPLAAKAVRN